MSSMTDFALAWGGGDTKKSKNFLLFVWKKCEKTPFMSSMTVSPPHAKSHKTYQKSEIFGKSMTKNVTPPRQTRSTPCHRQEIWSSVKKIGHRWIFAKNRSSVKKIGHRLASVKNLICIKKKFEIAVIDNKCSETLSPDNKKRKKNEMWEFSLESLSGSV